MKYKKLVKWKFFGAASLILAASFVLLNLLVNTAFKNILDSEISDRLKLVAEDISNKLPEASFLLLPGDRFTTLYSEAMEILNSAKKTWKTDVTLVDSAGKIRISTVKKGIDAPIRILPGFEYNITYFENGIPARDFIYPVHSGAILKGYLLLSLKGEQGLSAFNRLKSAQSGVMAALFIIAVLITFGVSGHITGRLEKTASILERMADDGGVMIEVDGNDEISFVQDRINSMASKQRQMQEQKYREIEIAAMGLAHEIKNPSAAVLNLIELAIRGCAETATLEKLKKAKEEILRLNSITERFIGFARKEPLNTETVGIGGFIDFTVSQYEGVVTEYVSGAENGKFVIDSVMMERALKNLLKNAFEAGAAEVTVSVVLEGGSAAISVRDDAPLISAETAEKMFVPFYTTKSTGMGIGLAITRSIIERHGGEIIYSGFGGSNVFTIILKAEKQ